MKLLQKLLLTNWHYIERELIEFSGINFLTGKNASGKSTIIDALQLLILGDTSGSFFNKAANDNSQRTLRGYLRGEVADDGETGFIYLRDGVFSSYIVAEFFDTIRKKTFCFGVVFDVYREDKPQHKFFLLEQPIPEHQFIIDDIPMDSQTLRNHLKSTGKAKHQFFDTNRSYQATFRGKMGGLNEKFLSLFKKAVPFSPIMDIEKFICEFVCDVSSRIEITDMQDNIRHYKQLEQEVGFVKERIERLTDISSKFQDFAAEQRRLQEQCYLMDRAQLQESDDRITELRERIRRNMEAITRLAGQVKQKEKETDQLEEKRMQLLQEKFESDLYKKMESLQKQLEGLAAQQEQLDRVRHELAKMMAQTGTAWTKALNCYTERIASPEKAEMSGRSIKVEFAERSEGAERAHSFTSLKAETVYLSGIKPDMLIRPQIIEELRTERLQLIRSQMKDFQSEIQELYFNGKSQLDAARKQATELSAEIANLKKGIKPYEAKLLELRQEIKDQLQERYCLETKHKADHHAEDLSIKEQQNKKVAHSANNHAGTLSEEEQPDQKLTHRASHAGTLSQKEQIDQDVPVEIFCELIEIRDKKWQDSIEGYLHTQKFYLLVPPEFFVSALKIYDLLKFERQFYDIGLVDMGKLQELNPRVMPGSLAEEVVTDNPYARVFADSAHIYLATG
jgi:energy-coupling factor transporter ATP-binding protein EcfA2